MNTPSHRRGARFAAALAGVVAGGVTLGIGELAGAVVAPSSAPFLAVGNTAVDLTPEWLKSFARSTFGANDKIVLLFGMGGVLTVLATAGGLLELWRRWWGVAAVAVLGTVAVVAALGRPTAQPSWAVAPIAGVVGGAVTLVVLVDRRRATAPAPSVPDADGRRRARRPDCRGWSKVRPVPRRGTRGARPATSSTSGRIGAAGRRSCDRLGRRRGRHVAAVGLDGTECMR